MANGSDHEGPARGDRVREMGAKHDRALQREIDAEREKLKALPADHPYRAELDSVSEVTAGPLKMKGVKDTTLRLLGLFALVAFLGWLFLKR